MTASRAAPVALPVDALLQLVLDLPTRKPAPGLPRRLNGLFRELQRRNPDREPDEIVDLIWALWISHEERAAEEIMGAAVEAIASGALDRARPLLDLLVARHPGLAGGLEQARDARLHRESRSGEPGRHRPDPRTRAAPFRGRFRLRPDLPAQRPPQRGARRLPGRALAQPPSRRARRNSSRISARRC